MVNGGCMKVRQCLRRQQYESFLAGQMMCCGQNDWTVSQVVCDLDSVEAKALALAPVGSKSRY